MIAVVIPNWNGGTLAVESAQSLKRQTAGTRLFVVDNASHDGSGDEIAASCAPSWYVRNDRNVGYSPAVNQGLRAAWDAGHEYVLLANNDVVFADNSALEAPLRFLENNPQTHGVCGRYIFPDRTFQRFYHRLPTAAALSVYWGAGKHVPGLIGAPFVRRYLYEDMNFHSAFEVEQPGFSCVLLRSRPAQECGELDENLPIFFNDVDYCWRWRAKGWTWQYLPAWTIPHHKSTSTSRMGAAIFAEMAGSISRFVGKHFNRQDAALVRASLAVEASWRRLRHGEKFAKPGAIWRGQLVFLENDSLTNVVG